MYNMQSPPRNCSPSVYADILLEVVPKVLKYGILNSAYNLIGFSV